MKKTKQKEVFQVESNEEIDNINDKLHLSYIIDLKKPNVDKIERAKIIQHYMKKHLLSFTQLSKKLQIGKSTLSGWLKWADVSPDEVEAFKKEGMSKTDITVMLKGDSPRNKEQMLIINLNGARRWIKKVNGKHLGKDTIELVTKVRNDLNGLLYRAEQ